MVRKGKSGAGNQERYKYEQEDRLFGLLNKLNNGEYCPSPLRRKQILVPKRRVAQVPSVDDKIVQHLICDGECATWLTKPLIHEATANTIGRGSDYASTIVKKHLTAFWREHHKPPYILKADIHNFFASIPHWRVYELIEKYVQDEDKAEIMRRFVNLTDIGLPLGLQQSQLLANLYLSELDHLVKQKFRFRYYARHMDDFYILSDSIEPLQEFMPWLENYLGSIGLELNPKTEIRYGDFDFLGFNYRLTDTGGVVKRWAKGKRKTKNNHLRLLAREFGEGKWTTADLEAKYFGFRVHLLKGNTRNVALATDRRFNSMLNEYGYKLVVIKHPKGKIRWRVKILPLQEEKQCQEQYHN